MDTTPFTTQQCMYDVTAESTPNKSSQSLGEMLVFKQQQKKMSTTTAGLTLTPSRASPK
jgi:hypothetical protein